LKRRTILIIAFFLVAAGLLLRWVYKTPATKAFNNGTHYKLVENWPQLPKGFVLGNPTGIGIDSHQNIVVFHRASREWPYIMPMPRSRIAENTVLILDRNSGKIIHSWGSNLFVIPHGLTVDRFNNIWVTDVGLHQVFKFSYDGKLLLKLGEAFIPGDDETHFNKPTDIAVARDGAFYVSDGYGNSRIIKFSASGKYTLAWGKPGRNSGEFDIPHAVDLDDRGNVYVADRENQRIQIFDRDGAFIKTIHGNDWGDMCSVVNDSAHSRLIAVDDDNTFKLKHNGSDILILDTVGTPTGRFGKSGLYKGAVSWYHDVTVDRDGNIYVADILGNKLQKFEVVATKNPGRLSAHRDQPKNKK